MNKLRIITAMTFTQLEERINEIGETFKIINVSLSEADSGRLKVAAVLLDESTSTKDTIVDVINVNESQIRIYNEFDGLRAVVKVEGVDYMAGNGGGVLKLESLLIDIAERFENKTGNKLSFDNVDFNKVTTIHVR